MTEKLKQSGLDELKEKIQGELRAKGINPHIYEFRFGTERELGVGNSDQLGILKIKPSGGGVFYPLDL